MKYAKGLTAGCIACLCALASLSGANSKIDPAQCPQPQPVPVLTDSMMQKGFFPDPAKKKFPIQKEFALAFNVQFDSVKPGTTVDLGRGILCSIGKDGKIELSFACSPTEIMASRLTLKSNIKAEKGKNYHIEANYSFNIRRCSLYVDGHWQTENDILYLPEVCFAPTESVKSSGKYKDLVFYDTALFSEDLAFTNKDAGFFKELAKRVSSVKAANKYIEKWADQLADCAKAYASSGTVTIAQVRRLERDIANLEIINAGIAADPAGTVSNAPFTSHTVPSTTQAIYLPYALPENGELTNKIEVFAAQGEYESASIVVTAFAPLSNFTIRVSDLKNGKNTLAAKEIDCKLVKRWYRTGGAWMTYHADKRQRVLTPDLLLYDDKAIVVDEIKRNNYMRLDYPTGTVYADISEYDYDKLRFEPDKDPFHDAKSLLPLDIPHAGRNQQYFLNIHVPENTAPGFYDGKVDLVLNGKVAAQLDLTVRVLPFKLPDPKSYTDLNKVYFSHINRLPDVSSSDEFHRTAAEVLAKYNLKHPGGAGKSIARLRAERDAGLDVRYLVSAGLSPREWFKNFGGPTKDITPAMKAEMDRIFLQQLRKQQKLYQEALGFEPEWYNCAASESSWYEGLVMQIAPGVDLMRANSNGKMMSHGMGDALYAYTSDFNSMDSATRLEKSWSEIWHSVGGRQMNYANPFPGAENPAWYRRKIGLLMYKRHFDGHMLHGYYGRHYNEFSEWPGGDGNYRNFCMAYAQYKGIIETLKLTGTREAYDDIRYATLLKEQAMKYRDGKDQVLAREARRQLAWLEIFNGDKSDFDMFRAAAVQRILALQELAKIRGGEK